MSPQDDPEKVWEDLAALINGLPEAERHRCQRELAMLIHDIRQSIGIIYSAESILRRKVQLTSEEIELLDAMRSASQRAVALLTKFAQPFDTGITLPIGRQPEKK